MNSSGDILVIVLELGITVHVAALVEEGGVDEVPVALPAAAVVLDEVGEGGGLHEGVVLLGVGQVRVLAARILDQVGHFSQGLWVFLLQFFISYSCDYRVG